MQVGMELAGKRCVAYLCTTTTVVNQIVKITILAYLLCSKSYGNCWLLVLVRFLMFPVIFIMYYMLYCYKFIILNLQLTHNILIVLLRASVAY